MCLVWKIVGLDKHSKPCPKHLGSFERQNCAIFLALMVCGLQTVCSAFVWSADCSVCRLQIVWSRAECTFFRLYGLQSAYFVLQTVCSAFVWHANCSVCRLQTVWSANNDSMVCRTYDL